MMRYEVNFIIIVILVVRGIDDISKVFYNKLVINQQEGYTEWKKIVRYLKVSTLPDEKDVQSCILSVLAYM